MHACAPALQGNRYSQHISAHLSTSSHSTYAPQQCECGAGAGRAPTHSIGSQNVLPARCYVLRGTLPALMWLRTDHINELCVMVRPRLEYYLDARANFLWLAHRLSEISHLAQVTLSILFAHGSSYLAFSSLRLHHTACTVGVFSFPSSCRFLDIVIHFATCRSYRPPCHSTMLRFSRSLGGGTLSIDHSTLDKTRFGITTLHLGVASPPRFFIHFFLGDISTRFLASAEL